MRVRLKLFFAHLFLFIGSVFMEQSQICVTNAKLVFWQDNLTHCLCRQARWWKHLHLRPMILRKKILCKKYQERVERLSQQNGVIQFCTDAGFLTTVDVGQHFMTKDTENSHNLQIQWLVVSTLCQERCKIIWPKRLDSREHQDRTRIGSYNLLLTR